MVVYVMSGRGNVSVHQDSVEKTVKQVRALFLNNAIFKDMPDLKIELNCDFFA